MSSATTAIARLWSFVTFSIFSLAFATNVCANACETVDKIPSEAKPMASGVVGASPFSTSFVAGQQIFVKVRNDTVHVTPTTITITEGRSTHEYCSSSIGIPPQTTLIFTTSVFGERVNWGVRVASDVDVVQLSVNVYAIPPQKR